MKFIADENIERPIILFLKAEGHDVLSVVENYVGSSDEDILRLANQEERILITNDKDFGELTFLQKKVSTGILLIRSRSESSVIKVELVRRVLKEREDRLKGYFVVVSERGYRVRPLLS